MKLIEKMAAEYHARNSDRLWLVDDERVWLRQVVEACWQDGFCAAREMAAEKLNHFLLVIGWEGRLMVPGYGVHGEKNEMPLGKALMDNLGETEVLSESPSGT